MGRPANQETTIMTTKTTAARKQRKPKGTKAKAARKPAEGDQPSDGTDGIR
jgi:hypothetical protein